MIRAGSFSILLLQPRRSRSPAAAVGGIQPFQPPTTWWCGPPMETCRPIPSRPARPFPIVTAPGIEELPSVGSGLLAFQTRSAGSQMDIGMLVLPQGTPFAVTADSALQANPAAGDGVVVWDDTRNHQRDIYRFDWTGTVPTPATYPISAPAELAGRRLSPKPDRPHVAGHQLRRTRLPAGTIRGLYHARLGGDCDAASRCDRLHGHGGHLGDDLLVPAARL